MDQGGRRLALLARPPERALERLAVLRGQLGQEVAADRA
jgi:hypothetical protein